MDSFLPDHGLENKMKMRAKILLIAIMTCLTLSACGPIQARLDATVTQIAGNIYATQTQRVPTSTQTYTSTPTPTNTPTPTLTPTPTNTPTSTVDSSILFSDDFSDLAANFQENTNIRITTEYIDGGYRMLLKIPNNYFWSSLKKYYSDVSIDVDGHRVAGPADSAYGVICRLQDAKNFYVFSIGTDGAYGIWKLIDGEWSSLGSMDWGFNDFVIKGGDNINHITAICNGDNLTLKVNGSTMMDVTDSDLDAGDVGMFIENYDTAGVDVLFDNFVVTRP